MTNNKNTIWMISAVVLVLILFGLFASKNIASTDDVDVDVEAGEVQKVTLSFENYEYVLEPSTLQAGVPVEMEVDLSTVQGCMQAVTIPAFGVEKYVTKGDNVITFTPDESGTFDIACSMNMGRGTFAVE